eukprot:6244716-Ditylum_brightwellii.AAC.1
MNGLVEGIEDPDFETVKQLLENYLLEIDCSDRTMNVKEFTDMVENQQRGLNRVADQDMDVKSRQAQFNKNIGQANSDNGEMVPNEDIIKVLKQEDGDNSQKSRKGKKRKHI